MGARLWRAVPILLALAVAAPAAAAGPELGARITPSVVDYPDQSTVEVTSLSTVPVTIAFAIDAPGWSVEAPAGPVAPGGTVEAAITAHGPTDARLSATLTAVDAVPGTDRNALVLSAPLRHAASQGIAWAPWLAVVPLAVIAAIVTLYGLYRGLVATEGAS